MAVRSTRSSVVDGLVFKKLVKEEDPNVPGAKGVYMAMTLVNITPAATSTTGAEQTFTPAELADLDPGDAVFVTPPAAAGSGINIGPARCSAAGTLAIWFDTNSGTPTPPAGNYKVFVVRVG